MQRAFFQLVGSRAWPAAGLMLLGLLFGCEAEDNMADGVRLKPLEQSAFFADGRSSRRPVAGTVPRSQMGVDPVRLNGRLNGQLVDAFPFQITEEVLSRGQQRYDIYCNVCHGATGEGDGMIVLRGFQQPPSLHEPRLREAPVGHYFDVITNGFGAMYDYADRIQPDDRWAIAAYIRVLQLSQNANVQDLEQTDLDALRGRP